jgi:light-regulated signal transduction histidine kinase (bacteriophytochrome)
LLEGLPEFARLLDAESGAIVVDDQVTPSRAAEESASILQLHGWCVANQSASVAAYEHLPGVMRAVSPTAGGNFCGLLSISVRAKRHGNRLLGLYFFRPEESMEIAWAGNPEKAVDLTPGSVKLSPRHSFDKWVEVRTGFSRPWDPLTMFTATQLQRRLEAIL